MYRKIAPTVIETMASNFPLFRQNIPVDFMSQFGVADVIERDENAIKKNVANMITTASTTFGILCKDYIDSAFDQMSKDYMIQALPPKLTKSEKKHSVVNEKEAGIVPFVLTLKSGIRFIRKHTQRLLFDPHGGSYIIHRMNNPRTFDSPLEQTVCVPNDFCSLYEEIARVYPEYITIEKVISYAQVSKQPGLAFIQNLYNHGLILVTEKL
uniref:DNA-directed RNA polymerase n=1 Tax=Rhabditophanes sp. KR3021 TaxID=114890 RepID=A0AC35UH97_9BILA